MIFHEEDLVESPKMTPELINEFNKVAVYKVDTQKSGLFLCTINKQLEIKILKNMSFIIPLKICHT